ncbi:uncharacterized protein LOC129733991 isoform X4 [Wyeomyia smithii]|nr:uncharacterized protein LOC129733991 isoform X4 [Wyeomyia smithii]
MPFKIVQTCEDGTQCLTVVPSGLECDGILYWPSTANTNAKLIRNEYSIRTVKWQQIPCTRKREFRTQAEAEAELAKMETFSDTDTLPTKKPRMEITPNSTSQKHIRKDFNEFVSTGLLQPNPADQEETAKRTVNQDSTGASNGGANVIQSIDQSSINIITANQAVIIGNQTKIFAALAQLKTGLDFLSTKVEKIESLLVSRNDVSRVATEVTFKPVDSKEALDALEASLGDDQVMASYVKNMTYICGSTGRENGLDCCYLLIDHVMTRQFLTQCSWTGMSRDSTPAELTGPVESQQKIPFIVYTKVRKLFLTLILQADSAFTAVMCDAFFKKVLKNSKQRLLSKTVSKHKNRPRNLQYSVRQPER